jgi:O-acetyl-ADP-ribose deacetylase (regulator of RNase III)
MRIEIVPGDITRQRVDVIVNAANSALLGGGGVDGAIHAAAGPELLRDCQRVRATTHSDGLDVGEAVATCAGRLSATWVVHTVGPNRHHGETDPRLLSSCYSSSLRLSAELGAASVAFPAVSAGVYGWDVPFDTVAERAFEQALGVHRRTVDVTELDVVSARAVAIDATAVNGVARTLG